METVNSLNSKPFVSVKIGLDLELLDRFMVERNIPREAIDKLKEQWSKEFDDFEAKAKWFLAEWIADDIVEAIKWNKKEQEN